MVTTLSRNVVVLMKVERFRVDGGGTTIPGPAIDEKRDDSNENTVGQSKGRKQEKGPNPEKYSLLSVCFCMGMSHKHGNYGNFACDWPRIRLFPCYTQR